MNEKRWKKNGRREKDGIQISLMILWIHWLATIPFLSFAVEEFPFGIYAAKTLTFVNMQTSTHARTHVRTHARTNEHSKNALQYGRRSHEVPKLFVVFRIEIPSFGNILKTSFFSRFVFVRVSPPSFLCILYLCVCVCNFVCLASQRQ